MNARKKAELLAAFLEEQRREGEAPAGSELHEAGVLPLAELAARLQSVPHPELSPTALTTGLVRVREELAARGRSRQVRRRRFGRLAWAAIAVVAALLLTTTGTVLAAGDSLPGDLLYPVKRGSEAVQLALTWRPEARSELLLSFAERRLQEVTAVCSQVDCPEDLLYDLAGQTEEAAAEIERLPPGKQAGLWEKMTLLTERQQEVLTTVMEGAPASARPGLERALERSRRGHERARQGLEKEKGPPPELPPAPGKTKPTKEPQTNPTRQPKPTKEPKPTREPKPTKAPPGPGSQ